MKFIIFHCSKDDCWIVARHREDDVYLGVAECPDQKTAQVVLDAMRVRQRRQDWPTKPENIGLRDIQVSTYSGGGDTIAVPTPQ